MFNWKKKHVISACHGCSENTLRHFAPFSHFKAATSTNLHRKQRQNHQSPFPKLVFTRESFVGLVFLDSNWKCLVTPSWMHSLPSTEAEIH